MKQSDNNISYGNNASPEMPDGFGNMINAIKNSAERKGTILTDEEIIALLEISPEQYRLYMDENKAPILIYDRIRQKFQSYVKIVEIIHETEHTCEEPEIPPIDTKED
jgi:hypothetical protein